MLQQTVSKTVIPYYNRFIKKFPTAASLAKASKKDLLPLWAGLGYYKRAESLMAAAAEISRRKQFPPSHRELLSFPGFGPYTARAVSSIAFQEPVGVLDGNVIRFLSRFHGLSLKWWTAPHRQKFQDLADLWVQEQNSSLMNQALMEIGSLICTSRNPLCALCPLGENRRESSCQARKNKSQSLLPLKRPKKTKEIWLYKPEKIKRSGKWAFVENKNAFPFLKGLPIFPGEAKKISAKPERPHFSHNIMNYQIFVAVQGAGKSASKSASRNKNLAKGRKKTAGAKQERLTWLTERQIAERNPSSLIKKILRFEE